MADQIRDFLDKIADGSITPTERHALDNSSEHAYTCRCETCRQWWKLVGPEEAGTPEEHYGPFTKEEVERA